MMLKSKKMHTVQFLHCMLIIWSTLYPTALGADEVCGQSSYEASEDSMRLLDTSTVDKTNATEGAWPWMAAIRRRNSSGSYTPWCSGFLISKRHVISAAHCFEDKNTVPYRVRIGHTNQNKGDEYRITAIAVPAGYKPGLFYDNIAILTLDRGVNSPNYNPICLPDEKVRKMVLAGRTATVAGWGSDKPRGEISIYLKQIDEMPILRNQECQRSFRQALRNKSFQRQFPYGISKSFLCAGFTDGKKDVCGGDSGGPLMIKYRNRWYAVGIISFGISCGIPGMPGGYTNVSHYLEWIKDNSRVCGTSQSALQFPDVSNTTEGAWPWMAAIRMRDSSSIYQFRCSGFLIDRRHVLSAAHCYDEKNNEHYRVRIGSINRDEGEEYRVSRIAIHEGYTNGTLYDDIAVLTLDREVNVSNYNSVCLPDEQVSSIDLIGTSSTIVGWKANRRRCPLDMAKVVGGNGNIYFQQWDQLEISHNQECQQMYTEAFGIIFINQFPIGINRDFICAGNIEGGKDDEEFVSGAPLMIHYNNQWYAIGVLSFGTCTRKEIPDGYVKISNYLDWIKENVED